MKPGCWRTRGCHQQQQHQPLAPVGVEPRTSGLWVVLGEARNPSRRHFSSFRKPTYKPPYKTTTSKHPYIFYIYIYFIYFYISLYPVDIRIYIYIHISCLYIHISFRYLQHPPQAFTNNTGAGWADEILDAWSFTLPAFEWRKDAAPGRWSFATEMSGGPDQAAGSGGWRGG